MIASHDATEFYVEVPMPATSPILRASEAWTVSVEAARGKHPYRATAEHNTETFRTHGATPGEALAAAYAKLAARYGTVPTVIASELARAVESPNELRQDVANLRRLLDQQDRDLEALRGQNLKERHELRAWSARLRGVEGAAEELRALRWASRALRRPRPDDAQREALEASLGRIAPEFVARDLRAHGWAEEPGGAKMFWRRWFLIDERGRFEAHQPAGASLGDYPQRVAELAISVAEVERVAPAEVLARWVCRRDVIGGGRKDAFPRHSNADSCGGFDGLKVGAEVSTCAGGGVR